MGMSLRSALTVASNYPDNVRIEAAQSLENNLFCAFLYLLRDGEIHTMLLSSSPVFDTEEEAINSFHAVAKSCIQIFEDQKKHKDQQEWKEV